MSSKTTQKQPQEFTSTTMRDLNVLIVGASGHLGSHICQYLCDNHKDKVKLSLLVPEDSRQKIASCESKITGSILTFDVLNGEVDDLVMMLRDEQYTLVINTMNFFDSKEELKAETNLIRAVSEAGVKYYIPADFSIDFRDIKADANLPKIEVRQQIHKLLNQTTNLKWISILCGVFVEKLLFEDFHMLFDRDRKTFSYYGTGDEEFQVSTYDDVAKFVSELIVRREFQKYNNQFLSIYSEQVTFKTLANWMKDIWGKDLKLQSLGNVSELKQRISQVKNTDPVQFFYMQLLMVILMKESKIKQLDNQVWPTIKKVGVKDVIRNWSTKSSNIAL